MIRLQKWMAEAGVASRRESEKWILNGHVKVNGDVVCTLGIRVNPESDYIEVKGKVITKEKKRTFVFNKPEKVITTMIDPQGRRTVADFFSKVLERVYPVGRLDYDTQGLLIVTNDGDLANFLTHPKYKVKKTYLVTIKGIPSTENLSQLKQGIRLQEGMTAPAEIRPVLLDRMKSKIEITIHEGKNRQVRRMFQAIGHFVIHLARVKYGFLTLESLKKGEYRELTKEEVNRLKEGR